MTEVNWPNDPEEASQARPSWQLSQWPNDDDEPSEENQAEGQLLMNIVIVIVSHLLLDDPIGQWPNDYCYYWWRLTDPSCYWTMKPSGIDVIDLDERTVIDPLDPDPVGIVWMTDGRMARPSDQLKVIVLTAQAQLAQWRMTQWLVKGPTSRTRTQAHYWWRWPLLLKWQTDEGHWRTMDGGRTDPVSQLTQLVRQTVWPSPAQWRDNPVANDGHWASKRTDSWTQMTTRDNDPTDEGQLWPNETRTVWTAQWPRQWWPSDSQLNPVDGRWPIINGQTDNPIEPNCDGQRNDPAQAIEQWKTNGQWTENWTVMTDQSQANWRTMTMTIDWNDRQPNCGQ